LILIKYQVEHVIKTRGKIKLVGLIFLFSSLLHPKDALFFLIIDEEFLEAMLHDRNIAVVLQRWFLHR